MSITTDWGGGMRFVAHGDSSGGTVTMDAGQESGGAGEGIRPMETLLSAVAGCSGMDVVSMLAKMRQDVTGLKIHVTGTRAEELPRSYVRVVAEYVVSGNDISEDAVARAVRLSAAKYCGAMASLKAEIVTTYRIEPAAHEVAQPDQASSVV